MTKIEHKRWVPQTGIRKVIKWQKDSTAIHKPKYINL